jgi:hypothetical protein
MIAFARVSISSATIAGDGGSGTTAASRSERTVRGVRVAIARDPERVLRSVDGSGVDSASL